MKLDVNSTPFVLVDTETTGLSPQHGKIIEIALLKYQGGQIVDKFETLLNPNKHIPVEIQEATGITSGMVENAPMFEEKAEEIREFLDDSIFVAHNVNFDYSFLRHEFQRLDYSFSSPRICTVRLARKLFPDWYRYGLDSVIKFLDYQVESRHRALDDALVVAEFLRTVTQQFPAEVINTVLNTLIQVTRVPSYLKPLIEKVPESAGVYRFYDENGTLLYVGKSKSMHTRVLSHFESNAGEKEISLYSKVADIDYQVTAGDLSAQILESNEIKERMPLFNRQLRRTQVMWYALGCIEPEGYLSVKLSNKTPRADTLDTILNIYRSPKQAKDHIGRLVKENSLCDRYMGLHHSGGICFGYHLHRCKGACSGEENVESYNQRVRDSFRNTYVKAWPFDRPVGIREYNESYQLEAVHVVDRWCYLGTAQSMGEVYECIENSPNFDYDTYKILVRFLTDPTVLNSGQLVFLDNIGNSMR
jgi:DNA polymerase III subunit epsilon